MPLREVGLEFVGNRAGVAANTPVPQISELEKLKELESECEADFTILYFHGGGFYFSSPAQYRVSTCRLTRKTKARVAAIRYRLSPQSPFPGALLDGLVAYASLIYPPLGSTHTAVPANKIILAGDSAGGNLCFGLTKVLLELGKQSPKQPLLFHGNQILLPRPAGLAVCSAWADCCDMMPSWHNPSALDIYGSVNPALLPGFPTDDIWPSTPPREYLYCSASMLDHEIVSPAAVKDWTGAPPMWFTCGSLERNIDGNRAVASQAAKCGVTVEWNEYEGMFHEFMVIVSKFPQTRHCYDNWAKACAELADEKMEKSHAVSFKMPDCKDIVELGDVSELSLLAFEEVRRRMRVANSEREIFSGGRGMKRQSKL